MNKRLIGETLNIGLSVCPSACLFCKQEIHWRGYVTVARHRNCFIVVPSSLSLYFSIYISLRPSVCLSVCPSVCPSVRLSVPLSRLSVHNSISFYLCPYVYLCPSAYLSVPYLCLSVPLSLSLSLCLSLALCLSLCPPISLSLCPSICLFVCLTVSLAGCWFIRASHFLSMNLILQIFISVLLSRRRESNNSIGKPFASERRSWEEAGPGPHGRLVTVRDPSVDYKR